MKSISNSLFTEKNSTLISKIFCQKKKNPKQNICLVNFKEQKKNTVSIANSLALEIVLCLSFCFYFLFSFIVSVPSIHHHSRRCCSLHTIPFFSASSISTNSETKQTLQKPQPLCSFNIRSISIKIVLCLLVWRQWAIQQQ